MTNLLAAVPSWVPDWLAPVVDNIDLADALRLAGVVLTALVLTWFARRLVRRVEAKVAEKTTPIRALKRTQTLTKVLSSTAIVFIWGVGGIYILQGLGYDLGPLLAGAGIIGLAVGFGAQTLVKDVIAGFFILLEDQYGVGDIVDINNGSASGVVETLTLRLTGLRGVDGTIYYLSNGSISQVANRSKEWARAVLDIGVGYGERPEHVREVLERVAKEAKEDPELGSKLYAVPEVWGIEMLGEYEVVWRMVAESKPARQWDVARMLRERIKIAFDEEGIEIPFPYRVMISADGDDRPGRSTPSTRWAVQKAEKQKGGGPEPRS
jgi:small conductance mechanosensitive channel